MKPKIKHDQRSNILSIKISKERSVDSDVKGNIVIDYDKNGEIVGVDIMKVNLEEFIKVKKEVPFRELVEISG